MGYNYIPKYIRQSETKRPKDVITAARWNELFNLLIEQGDYTAEELGKILGYLSTGLEDLSTGLEDLSTELEDLTSDTAVHIADDTIHVTTADKTAWNGKFDKTGGRVTGNVIASGAVGGSNLYADNGNGAVVNFSATGTAEQTEAAVTNEDGDLAPLLVADPFDDAHATSKYYVDRRVNEKLDKTGGVISGDLGVTGELSLGSTVSMEETNVSLLTLIGDNGEPVRIRNVDTPFADNDVATKKYVDEHSGGGGGGNNCEVKISYANGTYSADKTRDAIAEAIANGKFVYAVYNNAYYSFAAIDNHLATFKCTFIDVDEVQDITFDIYNDHVSREDITYDSVMNVVVEENDGEYTAYLGYVGTETVSFADIEAAINNNRTVVVSFENNKYPLSGFGNDVAQFVNTSINTSIAQVEEDVFVIAPDGVFRSDSIGQYTKLSVFDALEERVSELEEHVGGALVIDYSHPQSTDYNNAVAAFNSGRTVLLKKDNAQIPMTGYSSDHCYFGGTLSAYLPGGYVIAVYAHIGPNGSNYFWYQYNSPVEAAGLYSEDAGNYFTSTNVMGQLQEIGAELSGINTLIGSGVIE